MEFTPPRFSVVAPGVGLLVLSLGLAGVTAFTLINVPITFSSFFMGVGLLLLLILCGIFLYRLYGCWSLRYVVGRDSLIIKGVLRKEVIPLRLIERIAWENVRQVAKNGISWFGYYVGWSGMGEEKVLCYFTCASPRHLVYITAHGQYYALSVDNPRRFAVAAELCRKLGPLTRRERMELSSGVTRWPLWQDLLFQGTFWVALSANLTLFAFLSYVYPSLPAFLPYHFNIMGEVDRVGARAEVFKLPFMALFVLGGNSVLSVILHGWERWAAHLCLWGALLAQILFWVGAVKVVS
ncbi:MAG: DUF1648 domain-containing protein [Chloroflexi bacterium]|nr:DUF1648 domain-containing protein [Chloroflexota bacterium]